MERMNNMLQKEKKKVFGTVGFCQALNLKQVRRLI